MYENGQNLSLIFNKKIMFKMKRQNYTRMITKHAYRRKPERNNNKLYADRVGGVCQQVARRKMRHSLKKRNTNLFVFTNLCSFV